LIEARGLRRAKSTPEPDELIEVKAFSRKELRMMLRDELIKDGKTLVGLLWVLGRNRV
jgi:hypothetical protein